MGWSTFPSISFILGISTGTIASLGKGKEMSLPFKILNLVKLNIWKGTIYIYE